MEMRNETNLIGKDGRPLFGIHKKPLQLLNIEEFRPHGKPAIFFLHRRLLTSLRFKRWQYLGVSDENMVFGIAVVNLGYLSNLFAYVYDREGKQLKEFNIIQPLAFRTSFQGSSVNGRVLFESNGTSVSIDFKPETIQLKAFIKKDLNVRLTFKHKVEPLSIVTRAGLKGFSYTHKETCLTVDGNIRVGDKIYTLTPDKPAGVADYTLGYLGRKTFWNWASGSGLDSKGREIGFNFSQGINETGQTENVFWVNGKMIKTDLVQFGYDDLHLLSQWKITSNDGKVNLTFQPDSERKAKLNMGFIASYFHQPFGSFKGELSDGKTTYTLQSVWGFTEEHESKW
jgi:hypothetical protein